MLFRSLFLSTAETASPQGPFRSFFFFSTPGIHDPKTICGPKWKAQLSGNKKAKPTTNGRAPLQGRKTRGCLGRRTAFWRFPPSAQPAVGPSALPAHFPRRPGPSPRLCKQLCPPLPLPPERRHPLPPGPGLFGNNGGNVKQGWKTGSESLNSQADSLEGAGWREGRLGPLGEAWQTVGKVSRMLSSCPTIGCPPALPAFRQQASSSS